MANQKKGKYPEEPMRTQNETNQYVQSPGKLYKPGKTLQTKSWLVLVLHLIGWESDASFSGPITEGSK